MRPETRSRLDATLSAVCPITGTSGDPPRIDYAATATPEQRTAADAALAAFDWSDAAQLTWERGQARSAALAALATEGDYYTVGVRATFAALWTALNDLREHAGLPRLTEAEIFTLLGQAVLTGAGDPRG